ncbi:hypothetical protein CHS0354_041135 [Potamilus streckersoni]|uniref:Uncharacterized protein n=1 Tax=Potamilus streckersoni TaxID=2493646 RepID=A0AAE0SDN8_9BIVA|nr:hypothetical protein CHS0354_041135 [Potamilus streckersoni]
MFQSSDKHTSCARPEVFALDFPASKFRNNCHRIITHSADTELAVGKVIFGNVALLTVWIVIIKGAPSSITPAMAPSVCGNVNYRKWHVPCGMACRPAKDSGMQKDTANAMINESNEDMGCFNKEIQKTTIRRWWGWVYNPRSVGYQSDAIPTVSIGRIGNINMIANIERKTEYTFKNGNIDFKNEEAKIKSSNVTEIIMADYDSMAAAIMFTEQIRLNEDSSKVYGQMSKDLNILSVKLAIILCDFEIIQCISGNIPSTSLTCQSTVAGSVQSWTTEETRTLVEYWVLRDLEKYFEVLIPKYQLL